MGEKEFLALHHISESQSIGRKEYSVPGLIIFASLFRAGRRVIFTAHFAIRTVMLKQGVWLLMLPSIDII